jgi:homogentisate 1,2-dioxygenase
MARYHTLGQIPRKRHTQFRKPDGTLYSEQVFGEEGFSGLQSILYHAHPPTQVGEYEFLRDVRPEADDNEGLRHLHITTQALKPSGDPVSGRVTLLFNDDVAIGICLPNKPMEYFYKNADGDDLLFVHEGAGDLETMFGTIPYGKGDYLVIPRGTIYRVVPSSPATRMLVVEARSTIESPKRYRNTYGQLLEHSPYCERDIRVPTDLDYHDVAGKYEVRIKARGKLNAYYYDFHPLDVVGWDGYLYPWAFNIGDFEPITGSLHQPPPTHQTFQGNNFVVCSFVPRMLDYHPDAVPVPYNHSNLDSDELMYYVNGNYAARKGIEEGSMTLHPSGIPHGPQPGTVEASLGAKRTEELAVMLDTFRPLKLTKEGARLDDKNYPFSWRPRT